MTQTYVMNFVLLYINEIRAKVIWYSRLSLVLFAIDYQVHKMFKLLNQEDNFLPELVLLFGLGFLEGPLDEAVASSAKTCSTDGTSCWGEQTSVDDGAQRSTGTDNFRFGGADISNFLFDDVSNFLFELPSTFSKWPRCWWKARRRNLSDPIRNGDVSSSVVVVEGLGSELKRRSVVFRRTDNSKSCCNNPDIWSGGEGFRLKFETEGESAFDERPVLLSWRCCCCCWCCKFGDFVTVSEKWSIPQLGSEAERGITMGVGELKKFSSIIYNKYLLIIIVDGHLGR